VNYNQEERKNEIELGAAPTRERNWGEVKDHSSPYKIATERRKESKARREEKRRRKDITWDQQIPPPKKDRQKQDEKGNGASHRGSKKGKESERRW
jgi:hypothetical protein